MQQSSPPPPPPLSTSRVIISAIKHCHLISGIYNICDCDYNSVWHSESVCSGLKDWCALLRKRQGMQKGEMGGLCLNTPSVICSFQGSRKAVSWNPFCLQKVSLSRISKPALFLDWPSCIFEITQTIVKVSHRLRDHPFSQFLSENAKNMKTPGLHLHINVGVSIVSPVALQWTEHRQAHYFTGSLFYSTLLSPRHQIKHLLAVSVASALLLHLSRCGCPWDLPCI